MATADLANGGSGVSDIPVPTFLIEYEKGLVPIDTGLDPLAAGGLDKGLRLCPAHLQTDRAHPRAGLEHELAMVDGTRPKR